MTFQGRPTTPIRAWVRPPTAAYTQCLRADDHGPAPDAVLAMKQHAGYVAALREAGVEVHVVPPAAELADACFVEDTAVILGAELAVITRPGAVERRTEVETVSEALRASMSLRVMEGPATLDGGDVMRLGSRLVVGRSKRTNDAGIEQLRAFGEAVGLEVITLPVPLATLHLKSVCSALDDRTVIADLTRLPEAVLEGIGVVVHPAPEPLGANVLALGDRVLVSADAPLTAASLRERGHRVVTVALGEMHRGDGALSCLSLRIPPPDGWTV